MPLTEIQIDVLRLIAAHRGPDSYVGGATVIHAGADTPRYSQDLDIFHDAERSVATSAESDAASLRDAGFTVEWAARYPSYQHACVVRGASFVRLEWAMDSAVRFFPLEPDDVLGFRLHLADAATNKTLAAAARPEARDFVDLLHLHATYVSLGALCWAACGKDPGFTPSFLLGEINRHARYPQDEIDRLELTRPLRIEALKERWIGAVRDAEDLTPRLPQEEIGCLYLDRAARPVAPDPASPGFARLIRHFPTVGGAWPRILPDTA